MRPKESHHKAVQCRTAVIPQVYHLRGHSCRQSIYPDRSINQERDLRVIAYNDYSIEWIGVIQAQTK